MYKSGLRAILALIAPVVFVSSSAGAAPIFSSTAMVGATLAPIMPTVFASNQSGVNFSDNSAITFSTSASSDQNAAIPGDTLNIGTVSFTPSGSSGTSANIAVNFEYQLTLTDTASTDSGQVDLSGELLGNETSNPTSINTSYQNVSLSTNSLTLNGTKYFISLASLVGPSGNADGVLQLHVVVPEPASLSILSLSALCTLRRRTHSLS